MRSLDYSASQHEGSSARYLGHTAAHPHLRVQATRSRMRVPGRSEDTKPLKIRRKILGFGYCNWRFGESVLCPTGVPPSRVGGVGSPYPEQLRPEVPHSCRDEAQSGHGRAVSSLSSPRNAVTSDLTFCTRTGANIPIRHCACDLWKRPDPGLQRHRGPL